VKKCIAEGVPTVVDDGDLPDSGRLAYIGTNWTAIGQAQAKKMMEVLPNGGKLAMSSIINAGNMREAVAGFQAYIAANGKGKYQIVANEDDNGDAAKAAQVASALLAAHPDLAGIAGFDSESGAGIVTALREAGKKPGEVRVTAMEQTPDFFNTAKEGWVDGIVVQNRELFIYYAVRMLYDYNHNGLKTSGLTAAQGGVPIPPTIDTGVLVVTKDNVGKVLGALKK
jgi:ABC-type sugar transport system substrate-binding protein